MQENGVGEGVGRNGIGMEREKSGGNKMSDLV